MASGTNAVGFGIGGGGENDPSALLRPPPPTADQATVSAADDLRRIRDRYVQPPSFDPQIITGLAAGTTIRIDRQQMVTNAFVATVTAGTLFVFVGDFTGGGQPAVPHFQIATGQTLQFMLPPSHYTFTLQASGASTNATFMPMAL